MRTAGSTSTVLILATVVAFVLATDADLRAAVVARTVNVPIAGIVAGAPESVVLAGTLAIVATPVTGQVDGSPKQRLVLKLVDVSGAGLVSGAKYVAAGEASLVRPLAASDRIEIMFPFYPATVEGPLSARSAAATIVLDVDLPTGGIARATASLSAPKILGR